MEISQQTVISLKDNKNLNSSQFFQLLQTNKYDSLLYETADNVRKLYYGKKKRQREQISCGSRILAIGFMYAD